MVKKLISMICFVAFFLLVTHCGAKNSTRTINNVVENNEAIVEKKENVVENQTTTSTVSIKTETKSTLINQNDKKSPQLQLLNKLNKTEKQAITGIPLDQQKLSRSSNEKKSEIKLRLERKNIFEKQLEYFTPPTTNIIKDIVSKIIEEKQTIQENEEKVEEVFALQTNIYRLTNQSFDVYIGNRSQLNDVNTPLITPFEIVLLSGDERVKTKVQTLSKFTYRVFYDEQSLLKNKHYVANIVTNENTQPLKTKNPRIVLANTFIENDVLTFVGEHQIVIQNQNWTSYTTSNQKQHRILWAKGVKAPSMQQFKIVKQVPGYHEYKAPYTLGNGWYDTNKSNSPQFIDDYALCFAAVATNMTYWWIDQNKQAIQRYIQTLEANNELSNVHQNTLKDIRFLVNSVALQQNSTIYNFYKLYFASKTNGFQTDLLLDFFINGYTPKINGGTNTDWDTPNDSRAGFFRTIFEKNRLTDRMFSGNYQQFSQRVKQALLNNSIIGMEHTSSRFASHIVTLWGAEFDESGKMVAVFVTDSDDQYEEGVLGMKRYLVKSVNNRTVISENIDATSGARVEYLTILRSGSEYFK